MKALITGGARYIGGHAGKALAESRRKPIMLVWCPKRNLKHFLWVSALRCFEIIFNRSSNFLNTTLDNRREYLASYSNDYSTPDGLCVHDYLYVCDLVQAHVREFDAVRRVLGQEVPERIKQHPPSDPPMLVADASAASKLPGWLAWCRHRQHFGNVA